MINKNISWPTKNSTRTPADDYKPGYYSAKSAEAILKDKAKVKDFLNKVVIGGDNKIAVFREVWPELNDWNDHRIWRAINSIFMDNPTCTALKKARQKWLTWLDQKKVDILMVLESEFIYDRSVSPLIRLNAIGQYAKIAGFNAPEPTVITNINMREETQKELLTIFGIEQTGKKGKKDKDDEEPKALDVIDIEEIHE
jgi:hypothetical protein